MIDRLLRKAAVGIMRFAAFLMPVQQREWTRAMEAELAYVEEGPSALAFALGCCRSAASVKIAAITQVPEIAAGMAAGAFYAVHAAVPASGNWPWIWAAAAGVPAVIVPSARSRAGGAVAVLYGGAKAGAACGVIFFIAAMIFVTTRSLILPGAPSIESRITLLLTGACGSVVVAAFAALCAKIIKDAIARG